MPLFLIVNYRKNAKPFYKFPTKPYTLAGLEHGSSVPIIIEILAISQEQSFLNILGKKLPFFQHQQQLLVQVMHKFYALH
jgi:hypothetical protein